MGSTTLVTRELEDPSDICQQARDMPCMCRSQDDGNSWTRVCGQCNLKWSKTENEDDTSMEEKPNQAKRKEMRKKSKLQNKKKERKQSHSSKKSTKADPELERKDQRKKLRQKMKEKNKKKMLAAKAKKNQEKKEQLLRRQQQQAAENSPNLDTDSMNDDTVGRKAPRIDDPAYSPEMQGSDDGVSSGEPAMQKYSTVLIESQE